MVVAVLGASPNTARYSNKAIRDLVKYGHEVIPINPAHKTIEGLTCVASLADVTSPIDTLTVYVSPQHITPLNPGIVKAHPKRVVLNPGAESRELEEQLEKHSIPYMHACTLVMLQTKQF